MTGVIRYDFAGLDTLSGDLRAQFQRSTMSLLCVAHPKGQPADRWSVFSGEVCRRAVWLVVDDGVDIALAIQRYGL